jgi:hypothetical protein
MVKLGGPPGDPATRRHLEFIHELGFNAVWVYSHQAGRWDEVRAADGPFLDPDFLDLAAWCRKRGMRIFVSVNPWADSGGSFVFTSKDGEKRIRRFLRLLRNEAGVRDFVVSFDDQPIELTEVGDIVRYGRNAAPAHVDLVRRVERRVRGDETLWFTAAAYCDEHLGDGSPPYVTGFLTGLDSLPPRVGIVWTGPDVVSRTIRGEDVVRSRERLGGRRILLYDNYPVNGDNRGTGLALVLGPLRSRSADLLPEVAAYLACPMAQLGASRLPLITVADYLADPASYDPDASWARALERLAGPGEPIPAALEAQVREWGGWVGTARYRPAWVDSAVRVAGLLDDPGIRETMAAVARTYPARMEALAGLTDAPFREDLLDVMARRLAVARAFPLAREYRARIEAGRDDVAVLTAEIAEVREVALTRPSAAHALDRFLAEAGIPLEEN